MLGIALGGSGCRAYPYRHWLLHRVLPDDICAAIDGLRFDPPPIEDTFGKRETRNSTRLFFDTKQRGDYAVCDEVAEALQSDAGVGWLQELGAVKLGGSSLRIEYCLDTQGFWLEPHTDIGAKLFTMLVYLSDDVGSEAWGTDIYAGPDKWVATTPYRRNNGLIFVPAADTWHGFRKRPIVGVRRSLIVNYVKPEWRARHELAFPDRPVLG